MRTGRRLPLALRGYDRAQVDGLLRRIGDTLRGGAAVTADEVRRTRFDIVLRGYEPRAVDELLRECVLELQAAAPSADAPGGPGCTPAG
ncbi:DivIVA domain-containing protein [Actinomadura keratinilytica]|uniref:DivIVA domain-containing protein n=1 Tax=Actinomadura keratinilytica TaxID=547461 RepID=UPI00361F60A8